ncbi:hypothetical protein [Pseudoxanthomonas sp. GM95]|uniref:hypothetical protein n=1 Tax=Pseudoxanthomonas sp. GM95 TaxID=1881043 RepID=UPI000B8065C1|nr:hypothetical protein [Pseudoxanthomonas sp. GM95]
MRLLSSTLYFSLGLAIGTVISDLGAGHASSADVDTSMGETVGGPVQAASATANPAPLSADGLSAPRPRASTESCYGPAPRCSPEAGQAAKS